MGDVHVTDVQVAMKREAGGRSWRKSVHVTMMRKEDLHVTDVQVAMKREAGGRSWMKSVHVTMMRKEDVHVMDVQVVTETPMMAAAVGGKVHENHEWKSESAKGYMGRKTFAGRVCSRSCCNLSCTGCVTCSKTYV